MKIVILSYAGGLKELLSSELDKLGFKADRVDYTKPLAPQLSYANVIVNGLGTVDKSIIDSCPNLKLVHQVGIGIDNVDVKYCTSKSIYVANVPHSNHVSVAEHTIFLMLFFSKNMKDAETSLQRRRIINIQGSELKDKNLLVIGHLYYIPKQYINHYDGSSLWINVPSGLVGAKFERKMEPTQQEIDMLVKEAENKKLDEVR